MSEVHWVAQLLFDCETDVCGHPSEQEFHRAANEVQEMAAKIQRLEAAGTVVQRIRERNKR